jgi:hypothetical protein
MLRDGEVVARLTISAAFTDLLGKPRRIPEEFIRHMDSLRAPAP